MLAPISFARAKTSWFTCTERSGTVHPESFGERNLVPRALQWNPPTADWAKDLLEVKQEIARVRGEIEQMEAQQKSLEHRVEFATVNLSLTEEYKAKLDTPAASVATCIHNAFVEGYRNSTESLLGIVLFFAEYGLTLMIWCVILALPAMFLWRRYRRVTAIV
jgi:hypothetical protein